MAERAARAGQIGPSGDRIGGSVFVLEPDESALDPTVERDRGTGLAAGRSQQIEGLVGHVTQFAVEAGERHLGRVMVTDITERTRLVGEREPDGGTEHGIGEPSTLGLITSRLGSEQLGEPQRRHEVDVDDPPTARRRGTEMPGPEQPAGDETGEVRRHDHGDGIEGARGLARGDLRREGEPGRPAVRHHEDVVDHREGPYAEPPTATTSAPHCGERRIGPIPPPVTCC